MTAPGPGSRQPATRLAGAAYPRAPGDHPAFETSKMASKLWWVSWDGELELPDQSGHGPVPHRPSPGARRRDIAAGLGITERRAYSIVTDLADAGYVVKHKDGAATAIRSRRTSRGRIRRTGNRSSAKSWPS